jgi:F-type H+-transporting ATPase subunit delta
MDNPRITIDEKAEIMEKVFQGQISKELLGLLKLLVLKGHFSEIGLVFSYFIAQGKEHKQIGMATVTSALPLTEEQKKHVVDKLLATTKYKDIEIDYQVDKSLIGGMVIRIGDRVVDGSIKTKLQRLTEELSKIQLKEGEYAP